MEHYLFIMLFFVASVIGFGQEGNISRADNFFKYLKYREAIDNYKESLKSKDVNKSYVYKKISESYYALKDFENAKNWYGKYFKLPHEKDPISTLNYANLLRNYEDYDSALIMYQKYAVESNNNKNIEQFIELCEFPFIKHNEGECNAEIVKTNLSIGIDNMGIGFIENGLAHAKPAKTKVDKRTVYYDLVFSTTKDSVCFEEKAEIGNKANSIYYDGTPFFYENNTKLLFTRNYRKIKSYSANSKNNVLKKSNGVNLLQIFYMEKNESDKWTRPSVVTFENQSFNYAFPFYDTVHQFLYFSTDLKGGYGKFDVYKARFNDGELIGQPQNLGTNINSFDNDIYPYLVNEKLYYSSKGKPGFGGYDLFVSEMLDSNRFSKSKNLGENLNSSFDDFNLILNEKNSGYFASNRNSKNGKDEIFKVKLKFLTLLSGEITDVESRQKISNVEILIFEKLDQGWVEVKRFKSNEQGKYELELALSKKYLIVYDHPNYYNDSLMFDGQTSREELNRALTEVKELTGRVVDKITKHPIEGVSVRVLHKNTLIENIFTDSTGTWRFRPGKNKKYTVRLNERDYEEMEFEIPELDQVNYDLIELDIEELEMSPLARVGNILKIDNIYFDFNKSNIKEESLEIMDNIYNYLRVNGEIKVELSAHTDCVGKDEYNLKLSTSRAKSCYDYLINKGIKKDRIIPVGYGEQKMVAPDCRRQRKDKTYAQLNRRVEVKILE